MTDREKKLMMLGQSVLNLLVRNKIEWDQTFQWEQIDDIYCNAIDLGLADWVDDNDGVSKFTLTK